MIKGMQQNEDNAIKVMKMYEDYKLRVDKAIKLLEETCYDKETDTFYDDLWQELPDLLNILKGDDK